MKVSYFSMSIVWGKGHVSTTVSARTGSCFSKYIFHFPRDGCYDQNEKKNVSQSLQQFWGTENSIKLILTKNLVVSNIIGKTSLQVNQSSKQYSFTIPLRNLLLQSFSRHEEPSNLVSQWHPLRLIVWTKKPSPTHY